MLRFLFFDCLLFRRELYMKICHFELLQILSSMYTIPPLPSPSLSRSLPTPSSTILIYFCFYITASPHLILTTLQIFLLNQLDNYSILLITLQISWSSTPNHNANFPLSSQVDLYHIPYYYSLFFNTFSFGCSCSKYSSSLSLG